MTAGERHQRGQHPSSDPLQHNLLATIPPHWRMPRLKVHLQLNDSGVWTEDSDPDGTIVLRSTE